MKPLVVDGSVTLKWFFPEVHHQAARRLIRHPALLAPDLVYGEVANAVWKKCRRGELTPADGEAMIADILRAPLGAVPSSRLLPSAWVIARRFDRTIYDALYVAIAEARDCRLVTADRRLYNALTGGPLRKHLMWIEDVA